MIVGIFRSRLRDQGTEAYGPTSARMLALVAENPGFRFLKTFTADDGERLSLFEFDSLESLDTWKHNAEHQEAQRRGRDEFYASYELIVCDPIRNTKFEYEG